MACCWMPCCVSEHCPPGLPFAGEPTHDKDGNALEGKALDKARKEVDKAKKVRWGWAAPGCVEVEWALACGEAAALVLALPTAQLAGGRWPRLP